MYSVEELKVAVKDSISISEVLTKLDRSPRGANYKRVYRLCEENNIDITHFKGQGWSRGKNLGPKRPTEEYLNNTQPIGSHRLKLRLLKEGIIQSKCNRCKETRWLDFPIPLELEHKDGNSDNNQLNNLELLCPNCHAFTATYRRSKRSLE